MQDTQKKWVWPLGRADPLEEEMVMHSSSFACEFHGQKNLEGYSPWGHKESDTTEIKPSIAHNYQNSVLEWLILIRDEFYILKKGIG